MVATKRAHAAKGKWPQEVGTALAPAVEDLRQSQQPIQKAGGEKVRCDVSESVEQRDRPGSGIVREDLPRSVQGRHRGRRGDRVARYRRRRWLRGERPRRGYAGYGGFGAAGRQEQRKRQDGGP